MCILMCVWLIQYISAMLSNDIIPINNIINEILI